MAARATAAGGYAADTELAIMPFPFQHTEGDNAALAHVPFQIRNRPSAIPKGALNEAMSGMRGL